MLSHNRTLHEVSFYVLPRAACVLECILNVTLPAGVLAQRINSNGDYSLEVDPQVFVEGSR